MFDALTVAALTDQLSREIEFGRVQQVGLVSRQAVWFEIFANRRRVYLVASAENQAPAVYLTDREPVADRQLVTPLLLLLRKFARSGRVVSVQQPPLERVISLTFSAPKVRPLAPPGPETESDIEDEDIVDTEDEAEAVFTHLHCEIMGRHSNLILVDDEGLIMDSAKRVTPAMSRVRPILPRRAYSPPPPRIARDPRRATESEVASIVQASSSQKALIRMLPAEFQGMSPQVAEEAVFRAAEDTQIPEPGPLAQAIRHLYEPLLTGAWTPVIYRDSDDAVTAYSAQPMRHLAANYREEEVETISRAIEAGEGGEFEARAGRHLVRSGRLAASINDAIERLSNKLDALEAEEIRHGDREQFREWGELIFGYLWQIRPGDTELVVGDMRIPLDPGLDAKEQAQRYLQRYRDGKSADRQIGTARAAAELERDYLVQLRTLAEQATSIQDIEDLESEWRTRDPKGSDGRPARRTSGKKRTVPVLEVKGQAIFVGRSGAENDRVTFDIASPDDTWLHARGVPGSHVVVRWTGSERDDDAVLLRAAELAAFFSQSRTSGRVEVDITARRYVRKIKGAGPGMVTYRNERTVSVAPVGPD